MAFPQPGDLNTYQGTTLELIARTVVNLDLDYHVTKIYGSFDRPCSKDVKNTLESITFPQESRLDTIQNFAFYECTKLTKIDLSPCKNLIVIDDKAFASCSSLSSVTFPKSMLGKIGASAFEQTAVVNVFIPSTVSNFNTGAFKLCKQMKTLEFDKDSQVTALTKYLLIGSLVETFTIRRMVTLLISGAFERAMHLTSIEVDTENQKFVSVSNGVMNKDMDTFFVFPLGITGEYTLPNTTKTIYSLSFFNCKLTNVIIPDGLLKIDDYAFTDSENLKDVILPDSVTSIGINAFAYCKAIETIELPKNLKTISTTAFKGCSFSRIVIPEGVTDIGSECFYDNPNLIEVVLPSTVTIIGGNIFPDNPNLNITFSELSPLKFTDEKIIMDKNETFISQYMGKTENFSPTIPYTIQRIKSGAFADKENLVGMIFPENSQLIKIESYAFKGCVNLANLDLPAKLQQICSHAFENCNGLINIELKAEFTTLGEYCFYWCQNLESVNLQNSKVVTISKCAFGYCKNLATVLLPSNELNFEKECFSNCKFTALTIPEAAKVINIGDHSFSYNLITSFALPASSIVTEIGRYAFYKCEQLASITLCNSIKSINVNAFAFTGLTSFTLTEKITKLEDGCFSNCPHFTTFTIPKDSLLTEEGLCLGIFNNSISFSKIICESNNFKVSIGALFTSDLKKILIFPSASNIYCLPIPDSVNFIGNGAFINCVNLYSIIISKGSVHTIGNSAFEGCKNLHYINIPKDVVTVGEGAFRGCRSLYCGVDIESDNTTFLNTLFKVGNLPRNSIRKCDEITCKHAFSRTYGFNIFLGLVTVLMV